MRRKGVILLDGLMALFLISALAMMVLPLAGSWLSALERGRTGTKLSETGLFTMDFMVEKSGITAIALPVVSGGILMITEISLPGAPRGPTDSSWTGRS